MSPRLLRSDEKKINKHMNRVGTSHRAEKKFPQKKSYARAKKVNKRETRGDAHIDGASNGSERKLQLRFGYVMIQCRALYGFKGRGSSGSC